MTITDERMSMAPPDVAEPDAWKRRGLCAQTDPEVFFPEKGGSTRDAKRVCINCEVRPECLSYALDNDERFGIWGGYSERERRRLRGGEEFEPSVGHSREDRRRPNGHGYACKCWECKKLTGGDA